MLAKIGVNAKTLNFSHFTPQARLFFLEKKKAKYYIFEYIFEVIR